MKRHLLRRSAISRRTPPSPQRVYAQVALALSVTFTAGLLLPTLGVQVRAEGAVVGKAHVPLPTASTPAPNAQIKAALKARAAKKHGAKVVADAPEDAPGARGETPPPSAADHLPDSPKRWAELGLDVSKARKVKGQLVQTLKDGSTVTLTIDPDLQEHVERVYARGRVPHGGVVVIEPSSGRVLAMVSYNHSKKRGEQIKGFARVAHAPSASVFKVITAAALMEEAKLSPDQKVCYHGGRSHLSERNIKGDPRRDHRCGDLSDALAWSINSIMAKLAYTKLKREDLQRWARRFAYNETIPFELPVAVSKADIVADPIERARAAAGFWHTYLSPLHGALIGAAVQNDGVMMRPTLIDSIKNPAGQTLYEFSPRVYKKVMRKDTAQALQKMLQRTATVGTARRYFRQSKRFPKDIIVGGKTGTLSRKSPSYLGYTWFVGFAQDKKLSTRQVAVAGIACNTPKWHIKGTYAASEAVHKAIDVLRERDKKLKDKREAHASR